MFDVSSTARPASRENADASLSLVSPKSTTKNPKQIIDTQTPIRVQNWGGFSRPVAFGSRCRIARTVVTVRPTASAGTTLTRKIRKNQPPAPKKARPIHTHRIKITVIGIVKA